MENVPKEPPRIAVKFANLVFASGILFSVILIIYPIYKIYSSPEFALPVFYIISMLCGGLFAALFGIGLKRLSNNLRVNLSVLFFTIGFLVYGFETYLEFFNKVPQPEIIAKKMGIPYDTRTYMEVLDDLKDSRAKVFPNIYPKAFLKSNGLTAKKGRIYPLGTISNSITAHNNEAGYFPTIEIDEHGFNNPKGLYVENKVDIVLIGDSFTEGKSVHSNETISAVLRQSDFNVINVGKGGNGPMLELAALKEYAEPLKPKIVLWIYFVNDLANLVNEIESPFLKRYLDEDDYSQNLISRQEEIDDVLINYVQVEWEKEKNEEKKKKKKKKKIKKNRITNIIKLNKIRRMINLTHTPPPFGTAPIFRNILQKSKQMVSEWDGKMYFVYLPRFEREIIGVKEENIHRNFVMQTVTELDIPIIDIYKEVFDPHPDPLSLFALKMRSRHYNAEGYKLVAEAIRKRLEADGY